MESSIRKNLFVAALFGGIATCACIAVASVVASVRHGLLLTQTHNDLKWIVMALHEYHDAHGNFPPVVIRDENGTPLHSWRPVIQKELRSIADTDDRFDAYDLSQAWNTPTNIDSSSHHRFGARPYHILAVVGQNVAWHPTKTRSLSDFSDGIGNTLLLIAVRNLDCAWHEPVDALVSGAGTLIVNNRELDLSSDVFLVTADGAVRFAADGVSNGTLSALISIDAGDVVGDW